MSKYPEKNPGSLLEEFGLDVWKADGALVDTLDWGVYEVLDTKGNLKRVTFDAEIAQQYQNTEFISYGSGSLLALQDTVASWGRADMGMLVPPSMQTPGALEDKIRGLIHLTKCRPAVIKHHQLYWTGIITFRFYVAYRSVNVIEDIIDVLIDLATLADITALIPVWEANIQDTANPGGDTSFPGLPLLPLHSLDQAYARAVAAVSSRIHLRQAIIQKEAAQEYTDELAQSRHYYETTLQGLTRQFESASDANRKDSLQKKIRATRADWAHREADIEEAYHLSAEASLDQVRLVWTPSLRVTANALQRTEARRIHFDWYPWARQWAPVVCTQCFNSATILYYHHQGWHCGCSTALDARP